MAKLLSTIIKTGLIGSLDYVSGALGSGWGIVKRFGRYIFETDDLVVRGTMTVFELLIQKIRAIKGALGITQASGKIKEFREDANNYYIKIEDEMSFVANDIVKCQTFSGDNKNYWVVISAIQNNELVIPKTEFAGSSLPSTGDEIVQFGNTTDLKRQSAIYLHADENGEPAIDVLFGINSKSFDGCTKIRIGGAIPGEVGYKGFYCENGLIKSVNEAGEVMYLLRPDGSGFVAKEAIKWAKDGSGSIGDGAITWRYDDLSNRYVVEMGNNVLLRWENLSSESRENLKGLPGQNGTNGLSVFITYHDRETIPEKPTGNGTTNGWHTDATPDTIWMSQKITSSVLDGAWGEPIRLKGNTGTQGVPGTPGTDGKIYYTWIRFADDANGNGISNNPTLKLYMGLAYNKPTATESNNPLDYTWGRFRGEDGTNGVPGTPGIDGKTLYTWIAYSDNVDGKPMYQLPKATTRYIGISVNKETAIESTNPSDYTWSKFKGEDGDITSLPWLSDWNNNKTEIGGDHVVSPKMFSGTKNADGTLTGVVFGREMIDINGVKKTGIFGLNKGVITFMLDAETGKVFYGGEINVNNKFTVSNLGNATMTDADISGRVVAISGVIGGFKIDGTSLTNAGFNNDATVVFRNDNDHTFAAIGGNVLPPSVGINALLKIYNEKHNPFRTNYGGIFSASGGSKNIAIQVDNGDISLDNGVIRNFGTSVMFLDASYTIKDTDDYSYYINNKGSKIDISLPANPPIGRRITVTAMGSGSNTGIIAGNGGKLWYQYHVNWVMIDTKSGGINGGIDATYIGVYGGYKTWRILITGAVNVSWGDN